ncbi:ion transporter [Variovorax sp. PAMC26660]|uniref:ion transporter n=1 Tax=Variovorax sp. PAMC26660 TaxID=2762322 RepID=UPI00164E3BCC|nr:ion transporter [Variovorax sp. PAMC26660]QNK70293.1 ion transporter [Variovorax sp. PAMC26660]
MSRPNIEALSTPAATDSRFDKPARGWRRKLFTVIFEADTPAGLWFDLALIAVIVTSVLVVILDSVQSIREQWRPVFNALEWVFTILFTLEYIARLSCVNKPLRYALSFYGVIDLLALLPTFLVALAPELAYLIDVRILRLLRVFRIFKLSRYSVEYRALVLAVASSRRKITVFVGFVMLVVLVMGTLMYVVEGPTHGFTSIPVAIYWAISTMATVGFGDLVPKTDLGRAIASVMMLLGWGVLAVPTGIVTAEMARRGSDDDAAPVAVASRGVLAMTPPPTAAPARRITPAARRRALAQHRRGGR